MPAAKLTVEEKFQIFDAANPEVYALYVHFTKEALKAGVRKLSSKLLVERIRWETVVSTTGAGFNPRTGKPFLIDNRFTPWYVRKLIANYPRAKGLFELRAIRTP